MTGLNVKSGSWIWITGNLELVDCTADHGKERTKILKIYCSDFGFLPQQKGSKADAKQLNGNADTVELPLPEEIDGDRMPPTGVATSPASEEEPYRFFRMI